MATVRSDLNLSEAPNFDDNESLILYQGEIVRYAREPLNFGLLAGANVEAHGDSPIRSEPSRSAELRRQRITDPVSRRDRPIRARATQLRAARRRERRSSWRQSDQI